MDNSLVMYGMLLFVGVVLKNNYVELEISFNKRNESLKIILKVKKSA